MADSDKKQEQVQAEAQTQDAVDGLVTQMVDDWEKTGKEQLDDYQHKAGRDLIKMLGAKLKGAKVNTTLINGALDEIDVLIGKQMDEILHHDEFKKLESAWMGLKWLIERTDFSQNIQIDLLNATKKDLADDFEEAIGDVTLSGLYKHIYTSEYGTPNGKPFGSMVLNYEFSHRAPDVALLGKIAEIANMAHAPVITAASPDMFGPKGFEHLTDAKYSVEEAMAGEEYAKWNGLREDENSRYVGLALPHFLLRTPYNQTDNPVDEKEFKYNEEIDGKSENYSWGNAAFAFASRLTEAFKKYRWCWRILGEESGGLIEDMNVHVFTDKGEKVQKPPTDVSLALRKEEELTSAGFTPLLWLKEKDQSVIYRAPSIKKPLRYPDTAEGNKKERDDKLRIRLPYMFILTRFAHYVKRLQTKYIGQAVDKAEIKQELTEWIRQYVNQVDSPPKATLGRTPLKSAEIEVEEDPKNPGVFLCEFKITPHTLIEGFTTTLSLVTKQDTNEG
jgi:type VI secretion system protein ImpC